MTEKLKKRLLKMLRMLRVKQQLSSRPPSLLLVRQSLSATCLILSLFLGMSSSGCQKRPVKVQRQKLQKTNFLKGCEEKIDAWHEYFADGLYLHFYVQPTPEEFRELVDCGFVLKSLI